MGIKSNLLVQATKYNNKKIVKFTLDLFSVLDKFFSAINPFKQRKSFNNKSNEHLDNALPHAVENLNYEIVELLVNAGANIHLLDKDGKDTMVHAVERLAVSKDLTLDPSKNLPEEIISHPIVQLLLGKGAEYYCTDDMDIEGKYTDNTPKENMKHPLQLPGEPTRIFVEGIENSTLFVEDEPIYEEIIYAKGKNIRQPSRPPKKPPRTFEYNTQDAENYSQFIQDEPIYAEIKDCDSLNDSGYSSVEECEEQKKITDSQKFQQKQSEPIYAKIDLSAKREARENKAKGKNSSANCKKNPSLEKLTRHAVAGIYLPNGLVKEKVSECEKRTQIKKTDKHTQKINPRISSHVEKIKQRYENRFAGNSISLRQK